MFAERYRLKFARTTDDEKDEGSSIVDTDTEDDSDEYENALEDVEIDQSSELYKTIVAAIIENDVTMENEIDDDAFESQEISNLATSARIDQKSVEDKEVATKDIESESMKTVDITSHTVEHHESDLDKVPLLIDEAAGDEVIKR